MVVLVLVTFVCISQSDEVLEDMIKNELVGEDTRELDICCENWGAHSF